MTIITHHVPLNHHQPLLNHSELLTNHQLTIPNPELTVNLALTQHQLLRNRRAHSPSSAEPACPRLHRDTWRRQPEDAEQTNAELMLSFWGVEKRGEHIRPNDG